MKNIIKLIFSFAVVGAACLFQSCGVLNYTEFSIANRVEGCSAEDIEIIWQGPDKQEKIYIEYLAGTLTSEKFCIPVGISSGFSSSKTGVPFTLKYRLDENLFTVDSSTNKYAVFGAGYPVYIEINETDCKIYNQFVDDDFNDSKE